MLKHLLLFWCSLFFSNPVSAQPSGKQPWKTDIALGDFVLTTFLTAQQSGNTTLLSSPQNADKRTVGGFKSFAGRLFKKIPKKGSFLNIKLQPKGDSAIGTAAMPVLGNVEFRGIFNQKENTLKGAFLKGGKAVAQIEGHKSDTTRNNYERLYPKIISLAQSHIYSPALLQTPAWKDFDKKLKHLTTKVQDDIELFLGFSIYSQPLPFSHFNLVFQKGNSVDEEENPIGDSDVVFEAKTAATAYLKIKNFSSTQPEIAALMPRIVAGNYQNLILDLRNNGGGGLEAALELAKFVLTDSVLIGYFVTNRFLPADRNPTTLSQLPVTTATATEDFIEELKKTAGKTLTAPKPQNAVFEGKLYILTNNKTASTCEPIAYVLQNKMGATLVGQTTAGAMLSAAYFEIEGKYKLVLPIADFYAYDGKRLEGVGVAPTIALPAGEDALEKVLRIINTGN